MDMLQAVRRQNARNELRQWFRRNVLLAAVSLVFVEGAGLDALLSFGVAVGVLLVLTTNSAKKGYTDDRQAKAILTRIMEGQLIRMWANSAMRYMALKRIRLLDRAPDVVLENYKEIQVATLEQLEKQIVQAQRELTEAKTCLMLLA